MATRKRPLTPAQLAEANVKQLQSEAALPKMKVSVTVKEMMDYIEAHKEEDYLVKGFETSPKKNPFRKKKLNTCVLF